MANQFLANLILKGKIETLTGLHIGGSKEKLEIGGVDSPVIRDPHTNFPFIPGSSLKGKMRMLLEFSLGKISEDGKPFETENIGDEVCRIFGNFTKGTKGGPTRLIIRDAFPDALTQKMWEELDSELLFTEMKPENSIDRLTSEANPRFLERVVKGSFFNFEMVYGIYDMNDNGMTDSAYVKYVIQALKLLEHTGLGGNISRGYGQIKFKLAEPILVKKEDYINNSEAYILSSRPVDELNCSLTLDKVETFPIKL